MLFNPLNQFLDTPKRVFLAVILSLRKEDTQTQLDIGETARSWGDAQHRGRQE